MSGSLVRYPNAPGTKQGSPDTAHNAGQSFKAEAWNRRLEALRCVRGQGANGATCDEVAKFCGWEQWYSSRPRLAELHGQGAIADSGFRRRGRSGRFQTVWVLPEHGPTRRPKPQFDFLELLEAD